MAFIYDFSSHNIVNISGIAHLITEQNVFQVCAEEIMFKPLLALGQTGGVTMAPLFAQPDRQMVTGFPLTITHRKEEINSKYKNVPSVPVCDAHVCKAQVSVSSSGCGHI